MGVARLVVIEGPDLGCEFEIPLRGGGIGREAGNVVQLSDLSVSRAHCSLELREGKLALIDGGSRNRTLVNGQPVTVHILGEGDEIAVGKTRLAYLPGEGGVAVMRQSLPGRVTMEIGSRELLKAHGVDMPGSEGSRARRHLAALAGLGEALHAAESQGSVCRAACEAALAGLSAQRAFLLLRDAVGRMSPSAAALAPDATDGAGLSLPREVVEKALDQGKALALDTPHGPAVAAPVYRTLGRAPGPSSGHGAGHQTGRPAGRLAGGSADPDQAPIGLLYADRRVGASWDQLDLMAANTLAYLLSAALAGFEVREALSRDNRDLADKLGGRDFVGESPPARAVLEFVAKVGPSDATVLLTGESGSGKEMVARAVHRASRRSGAAFIAVNCAALTESLIESELFGHEKGAFTGATERKLGRFELADKGTLFLDEVGELPPSCQTKFLRVLEEQVFERVGGARSIAVDVRVIAATNRDLLAMAQRGQFREDLYYRLSVIHTVVPPLRERPSDIALLAEYFLARLRSQVPRRIAGFTAEAMRALTSHSWPGNVRELKNAVERAIVLGEGDRIRAEDLPPHVARPAPGTAAQPGGKVAAVSAPPGGRRMPTAPFAMDLYPPGPTAGSGAPAHHSHPAHPAHPVAPTPPAGTPALSPPRPLRELEKDGIIAALSATGGNKAQAAALLEIDRSTLYKKIKDYGIQ